MPVARPLFGNASIQHVGTNGFVPIESEEQLAKGDLIRTAINGGVLLILGGDISLEMHPDTQVLVDELGWRVTLSVST